MIDGSVLAPFPAIALYVILLLSDHYLTLHAARLYQAGANEVIILEGSYELNPRFAADVDSLRGLTWRFVVQLVLAGLFIWLCWYLAVRLWGFPRLFGFIAGAILLIQGPIHIRHVRNIVVFRSAKERRGVVGRVEYSRDFSYMASAVEFVLFSVLYLVLGVATSSLFLVGGAFACSAVAARHYLASKKGHQNSHRGPGR